MSLKGDKYESVEEVKFRLEKSVVLYDGEPVYIKDVGIPNDEEMRNKDVARVYFVPLPYTENARSTRKFLSSRKFDLEPFKMGYCNVGSEAVFVRRVPIRQQKQGLCPGNIQITNLKGNPSENYNFDKLIRSQGFVDMAHKKYPRFAEVGDLLEGKVSSVALSGSFAVNIDQDLGALELYHRGVRCGLAFIGDKAIKIPDKFKFLKEEAEECLIPLA